MGGGNCCAVATCTNMNNKCRKMGLNLSFYRVAFGSYLAVYRFPRLDDDRRNEWIRRCRRKDQFNPDTSRICSAHFENDDFEIDMRSKIMGYRERKILKPTAIPSLIVPTVNCTLLSKRQNGESSRFLRMKRKIERQNHTKIINGALTIDESTNADDLSDTVGKNHNATANVADDESSANYRELVTKQGREIGAKRSKQRMTSLTETVKKYSDVNYSRVNGFLKIS